MQKNVALGTRCGGRDTRLRGQKLQVTPNTGEDARAYILSDKSICWTISASTR